MSYIKLVNFTDSHSLLVNLVKSLTFKVEDLHLTFEETTAFK